VCVVGVCGLCVCVCFFGLGVWWFGVCVGVLVWWVCGVCVWCVCVCVVCVCVLGYDKISNSTYESVFKLWSSVSHVMWRILKIHTRGFFWLHNENNKFEISRGTLYEICVMYYIPSIHNNMSVQWFYTCTQVTLRHYDIRIKLTLFCCMKYVALINVIFEDDIKINFTLFCYIKYIL